MKITKSNYKDLFAFEVETEKYMVLILPEEGGKIASFQRKTDGKEYLVQNSSKKYLRLGKTGDFEKSECSGFDDMFPTIDPVTVENQKGEKLYYPDHGEICRLPFEYEIYDDRVKLFCRSEITNAEYIKTVKEGKNGEVVLHYEIINSTLNDLSVLWAAHCLVRMEKGGRVLVPFNVGEAVDIVYDSKKDSISEERRGYLDEDLFTDWEEGICSAKKLYFPGKCREGYAAYRYPSGDVFVLKFSREKLPYIGIWQDNGMVNGTYAVGLEPCTAGYDTVKNAKNHSQECILKKGEKWEFDISLFVVECK